MPVDQATVDRLRTHDWGADPFERVRNANEPYRTRLVNGRCFFLDGENRCRIHTEISYDAKPTVCKAFPLAVLEVGGKQYARTSFWCPTVAANTGKPLLHQSRWLKETAKHSDHRTSPMMIGERKEISPRDAESVHRAVRRFLLTESLPIADRLAAAAGLILRLDQAAKTQGAAAVGRVLGAAESEDPSALAGEARHRGHASSGRRMLALYLLEDWRGGRLAILARFLSVLLFTSGFSKLRCRVVPARASWSELRSVAFEPSAASDELLTRYLCSKIDSRRYVAGDATLMTGVNLLLAAYGVINILARMRAASEGRMACDDEDVRLAVAAADYLVVEHRVLRPDSFRARFTKAALGNPDVCGDLSASLG